MCCARTECWVPDTECVSELCGSVSPLPWNNLSPSKNYWLSRTLSRRREKVCWDITCKECTDVPRVLTREVSEKKCVLVLSKECKKDEISFPKKKCAEEWMKTCWEESNEESNLCWMKKKKSQTDAKKLMERSKLEIIYKSHCLLVLKIRCA